ncbi:unnamed protein product [Cylicocyclus nassatus]|uniref:C2H2-type domain-containing protein n=1 Tax=Cylicocyclus nassatus TaxID=53992 RepID=A0AA36GWY2_CYLNA|nr:unnamed protein product [Cylicocyclus nassatus]
MTEENLVCSLCSASFSSKQSLTKHIHQHLFYRKYECGSCADLFYTDEEREAHCKKKGHFHTFGMRVSSYCELYVNQFLKDIEHIATYGIDNVVMQRSKANLACDTAISKLPRKSSPVKRKRNSLSPSHRETSLSKSNNVKDSSVNELHEHGDPNEADEYLEEPSTSSARKVKESRKRIRMPSDDWMRIEVDNTTSISPATQILSEALRTNAPEVRCTLCKAMTSSDYVLRKHHVSSVHMPKDHTESDYVEILSALMQKAYPTMTYNDLQCQIGGCRKEYKCQSARRNHVLRIHFQNELSCPIKACSFRSNDFPRINTHLKEDHGLANGYQSISSAAVRDQFNADRAKHNHRLTTLVQLAFPCNIPEICKSSHKADVSSSGAVVQSIITRIREKDRKFQTAPPNPLRLRSPSTSSDSDSSETEKIHKSPKLRTTVCVNKSGSITISKDVRASSASSPTVAPSSISSGSSSDSEDANRATKAHSHSLLSKHERTKSKHGHREKVNSPSSPSTLENGDGTDKEADLQRKTDEELEPHKENEEPGSDVDSLCNNAASEKSGSAASECDDVQVVAYVSGPPASSTPKQVEIEEVVLEDNDKEVRAAVKSPSSNSATKPKQPEYRTLSISGVSVRTDGEKESFFRPAASPGVSRTLPISGISIRADGTPIRPHTESYRRSFPNMRHSTPQRYTSRATEQYERRRELARRKFDLAEQKRMQGRKNIPKVEKYNHASKRSGTPSYKNSREFRANSSTRSPFKRPASEGSHHSRGPSYVVPKVKREVSSYSDTSPRPSNTWRGKIKRFED